MATNCTRPTRPGVSTSGTGPVRGRVDHYSGGHQPREDQSQQESTVLPPSLSFFFSSFSKYDYSFFLSSHPLLPLNLFHSYVFRFVTCVSSSLHLPSFFHSLVIIFSLYNCFFGADVAASSIRLAQLTRFLLPRALSLHGPGRNHTLPHPCVASQHHFRRQYASTCIVSYPCTVRTAATRILHPQLPPACTKKSFHLVSSKYSTLQHHFTLPRSLTSPKHEASPHLTPPHTQTLPSALTSPFIPQPILLSHTSRRSYSTLYPSPPPCPLTPAAGTPLTVVWVSQVCTWPATHLRPTCRLTGDDHDGQESYIRPPYLPHLSLLLVDGASVCLPRCLTNQDIIFPSHPVSLRPSLQPPLTCVSSQITSFPFSASKNIFLPSYSYLPHT